MEAMSYVKNHSSRHIAGATVTSEQAESAIDGRIEVKGARLALIPLDGEELLCHEFNGTFDGREYFVYVDARTGEEVQVLTNSLINQKRGAKHFASRRALLSPRKIAFAAAYCGGNTLLRK